MKTSNKLIVIATMLTVIALIIYDFSLKAEYTKGDYKIPYKNYIPLPWKNFDEVEVNASTVSNVKFVQGPFSVRVDDNAFDIVKVSQIANRLKIDASFENSYHNNPNEYILVITCPKLMALITRASYHIDNTRITDSVVREDWNMRRTLIEGFTQDSLSILQDYGSTVSLANNKIRALHALVGESEGSGSKLIINESNQFQAVDVDIRHVSKLQLENAAIKDFSYRLADSARLTINGNAQTLLNHSKTYR